MHFIDFIDIEEQYIDVYVYTKDKRIIVVKDMVSDIYIDDYQVSMDHMSLGQRVSFAMLREDFSHLEYIIKDRSPREFDHG